MSNITEKIAWPAQGIRENSYLSDYTWGYLTIDASGKAEFDDTQAPTKKEILAHWSHYLEEHTIE